RLFVLGDARVDAFAATDAAGEVQTVNKLDAVHWLEVAHVRTDSVLPLDLALDARDDFGHVAGCEFLVVFLEKLFGGSKVIQLAQRRKARGEGGEAAERGAAAEK